MIGEGEFIGRDEEMDLLRRQYEEESHPLVPIIGRRRVGKSELVCRFLEGRNALYYEADRERAASLLKSFSRAVCGYIGEDYEFRDWEHAIRTFVTRGPPGRKILAIDEFQYIAMSDPDFIKEFQGIWDNILSKADVMVIVCGSYISMMRGMFTDHDSPMYGRKSSAPVLLPIRFRHTIRGRDYRTAVEEYAFTGGVPYYMMLMHSDEGVMENIVRLTMSMGAPLLNEPRFLLSDELRDPTSYLTYMKALSQGNRSMEDITSAVQAKSSSVIPYLNTLEGMGLVERRVPVTEKSPEHSRNGQYVVTDHFIKFWFRFVQPRSGEILRGMPAMAIEDLKAHYVDAHVAFVFEDICRRELYDLMESRGTAVSVGSYWDRGTEIDVVALDSGSTVYAGECKFRKSPVGADVLNSLMAKCATVHEFRRKKVIPCLFSVSGYTESAIAAAEEAGAMLFDCGEVVVEGGKRIAVEKS